MKRFVVGSRPRTPAPKRPLDVLRFGQRRLEAERDVVGEDVAADRNRRAVDRRRRSENTAMSVVPPPMSSKHAADVLLFGQQRRRRAGQRLEHDPGGFEPGAVHALEHVGDEGRAAGDRCACRPRAGRPTSRPDRRRRPGRRSCNERGSAWMICRSAARLMILLASIDALDVGLR